MSLNEKIDKIKKHIANHPDFPVKNVIFRDIFSVLREPDVFTLLFDILLDHVRQLDIDYIVALDSRGFIFGSPLSLALKKPFVPIRKKGKLPGPTKCISYKLEYGEDVMEMQEGCIRSGGKVLLIDDLLATGGSLAASCELVKLFGGIVVESLVIIELVDLHGRNKVPGKVHSIVQY